MTAALAAVATAMRGDGWLPVATLSRAPVSSRNRRSRWVVAKTERAARIIVGARVMVALDNGWRGEGTVTKLYKSGPVRVRDDESKRSTNRALYDLWVREPWDGDLSNGSPGGAS